MPTCVSSTFTTPLSVSTMNSANHDHDEFSMDLEWDQNFTIPYTDDFPFPPSHDPLDSCPEPLPMESESVPLFVGTPECGITMGQEPHEKALFPNLLGIDLEDHGARISSSSYNTDNSDM